MIPFGPNPRSFGQPDVGLGFGYVMNQMQLGITGGSHGFTLIAALYEDLGELGR
jgi:hypothetical protein